MTGDGPAVYTAAADWALRLDAGELTLEEQARFEAWLADPDHEAAFRSVAVLWRETDEVADAPAMIEIRADALAALRHGNRHRWRTRLEDRWRPLLALAACLLLMVAGGLRYFGQRPAIYETGSGERRVVRLEDGSRLSLDAASRIEVAYSDERRALRLIAGRAKFDVAKDPRRPFTVTAADRMVVATGTAFSVELVRTQMRVVLYEGAVAVLEQGPPDQPPRHVALPARRGAADQILKPGTQMVADLARPIARVEPTDLQRSLSWQGGQLVFDDEPLDLAVARLNRYAERPVRIADRETGRLPISGAFNAGDTDGFLDGLRQIYPIRVIEHPDSIEIRQR